MVGTKQDKTEITTPTTELGDIFWDGHLIDLISGKIIKGGSYERETVQVFAQFLSKTMAVLIPYVPYEEQ